MLVSFAILPWKLSLNWKTFLTNAVLQALKVLKNVEYYRKTVRTIFEKIKHVKMRCFQKNQEFIIVYVSEILLLKPLSQIRCFLIITFAPAIN